MDNTHSVRTERKSEVLGAVMLVLTVLLFFALVTDGFEAGQHAGRPLDGMLEVPNSLGAPGALVAGLLSVLVGDAAHAFYAVTFIWMLKFFVHHPVGRPVARFIGMALLTGAVAGLLHIDIEHGFSNAQPGGMFGAFVAERFLLPNFGLIGSNVIGITVALMGTLLATDFLLIKLMLLVQRGMRILARGVWAVLRLFWQGIRWLFGGESISTTEPALAAAANDAYEIAPDLSGDVPGWDPPSPQEKPQRFVWLLSFLQRLKPRVTAKPPTVPEVVPDTPTPHVDETPDIEVGATAHNTAVQFHLPDEPSSADAVPVLPFEDIPDSEPEGVTEEHEEVEATHHQASPSIEDLVENSECDGLDEAAAISNLDIHCDRAPEGKVDEEAPTAIGGNNGYETPPPDAAQSAEPSAKITLPVEPPPVKPVPRLRRKPVNDDDLPEDYTYPPVYMPPSLELFTPGERRIIPNLREKLGATATRLEETLRTFGLEACVTDVTRGPTITRFELEPAPGMKVSRFLSLTDDIALALKARGVRVEAPIPGKGRVGIEVSNEERDPVVIRELLEHTAFSREKKTGRLDLALGKDISGDVCIADLMRMPHLLVAGATGSGKTVCIKALLASLLYQHTPDELQLMLIDPKMVELSIFNDIPHLITPVVTDPKKASTALVWLINEMEERYRLFADLRVRNIEVYNESVQNGEIEMEGHDAVAVKSVSVVRKLPFIVCVIDELADLMMLARAEVEDSIGRLAQLARAVGIHLIIATQRPSVDVLTGVIKANFPARISFQVSSRVDSRCILDEIGAERLIGMGDMLYQPAGQSKPARIQGAFVSDEEMLALIAYLKRQAPPQYRDEIANFGKNKDTLTELAQEEDPLFEDAVRVVLETGQASISMVQRRLRVGYTRAARLIDMMELKGIVGPHTGSKAREILVQKPPEDDSDERD